MSDAGSSTGFFDPVSNPIADPGSPAGTLPDLGAAACSSSAGVPRTDHALLDAFLAGDDQAFATLVERHGPMVLGTARRILGRSAAIDDATQGAFVVLARRAADARAHPVLGAWLHRVACNVALNERTRSRLRALREREAAEASALAAAAAVAEALPLAMGPDDLSAALDAALAALPERYRVVVVLHHLQGQREVDIASTLGVSESAISMRLTRARRRLRQRLQPLVGARDDAWLVANLGPVGLGLALPDAPARAQAALAHARLPLPAMAQPARMRWLRQLVGCAAVVAVLAVGCWPLAPAHVGPARALSRAQHPLGATAPAAAPAGAAVGAAAPALVMVHVLPWEQTPKQFEQRPILHLPPPRVLPATPAVAGQDRDTFPMLLLRTHDEHLVMVGVSQDYHGLVLARYDADGRLDHHFGTRGVAVLPGYGNAGPGRPWQVVPHAARIGADGVISIGVLLYSCLPSDGPYDTTPVAASLVRVQGDGTLVSHRADAGTSFDIVPVPTKTVAAIADGAGALLFAGQSMSSSHGTSVPITRLLPDGRSDPGYGVAGTAQVELPGLSNTFPRAGILEPDGTVLWVLTNCLADATHSPYPAGDLLVRLTPGGTLDGSFGVGGVAALGVELGYCNFGFCGVRSIALQDDGKILVAGNLNRVEQGCVHSVDALVVRLTAAGVVDTSFGVQGRATIIQGEQGALNDFMVDALAVQRDGRILLGGAGRISADHWRPTLACLDTRGGLDPDFGQDGVLTGAVGTRMGLTGCLLSDTPNEILMGVAASFPGSVKRQDMALVRLSGEGRPLPEMPHANE